MATKTIFGGMLGSAEKDIKERPNRLQEAEDKAMGGGDDAARKKKNEDAANGKVRLVTDDKKY